MKQYLTSLKLSLGLRLTWIFCTHFYWNIQTLRYRYYFCGVYNLRIESLQNYVYLMNNHDYDYRFKKPLTKIDTRSSYCRTNRKCSSWTDNSIKLKITLYSFQGEKKQFENTSVSCKIILTSVFRLNQLQDKL